MMPDLRIMGDRLTWWRRAAMCVLWAEYAARLLWAPAAVLAGAIGLALLGLVPSGAIAPTLFLVATRGRRRVLPERRLPRPAPPQHRTPPKRGWNATAPCSIAPLWSCATAPPRLAGEPGLWSHHLARAQTSLARLRLGAPGPGLAAHDPAALRFLALFLLVAGVAIAGGDSAQRLRLAFLPSFGAGAAVSVTLQGWVEPPPYTGLAPILLPHDGGTIEVPQGSRLNVSLTGGRFKPHLATADGRAKFHTLGPGSWQASTILHQSGTLSVSRFFSQLGSWNIAVLANDPPVVNWSGVPGQAGQSLEFAHCPGTSHSAGGVNGLHASLAPIGHPDVAPVDVTLPLPRHAEGCGRHHADGSVVQPARRRAHGRDADRAGRLRPDRRQRAGPHHPARARIP